MTKNEFKALVSLLDDPDIETYGLVENKLTSLGEDIVPMLFDTWGHSTDKLVQTRAEQIIDTIRFNNIASEFEIWSKSQNPDLLDGFSIINRFQYPGIDTLPFYKDYEKRAKEIWLELNDNLTAYENIRVINRIIFEIWGFSTVSDDQGDRLEYNFISNMMELKCGNQFTIGSLYLILAAKLDLPLRPVLIEDQLILAYISENEQDEKDKVLFYINPFEQGVIFDASVISHWIQKFGLEDKSEYYRPVSNKALIQAYIQRLISGYVAGNEEHKVHLLSHLIS